MLKTKITNDTELVRQALDGQERAVTELYRRYAEAIFRYGYYQLGDEEKARDLMQDTFVQMIHSLRSFSFTGSFKNWLYTIAKRQVLSILREKYKYPLLVLGDYLPAPDTPDWIDAEKQDGLRLKLIKQLLQTLSETERALIELCYLQGMTSKEAGIVTGRTPESVRVILHRSLKKLQKTCKYEKP